MEATADGGHCLAVVRCLAHHAQVLVNGIQHLGSFQQEDLVQLGLIGRFPSAVETLDQQAARAYAQLPAQPTNLDKYVFLDQLHNRNEVLYYRVLTDHLPELLPIVYDPTVGEAIKKWSRDYRRGRRRGARRPCVL